MRNDLDPLDTALALLERGLWPVAIHPRQKRPIGEGWGLARPTEAGLRTTYRDHPGAGVGVVLGPAARVSDIDVDGPEGERSLAALLGGERVETLGWSSARGPHSLFRHDPRLARFGKSIVKRPDLPGLEIRLGAGAKQIQSVCPPTPGTDGRPRRWNDIDEIARLPESALRRLEAVLGEERAGEIGTTPGRQARGVARGPGLPPDDEARAAAEALQFIPESWRDEYDRWMLVGFSLHQLGEAGLRLWTGWSRGSTKYQAGDCRAKWATMSDDKPTGATLGTLYREAMRNGWHPPWVLDEREPWPPLRLADSPRPLPFPVEVFPPPLRDYCREVAATQFAPLDFVGAAMLAVAGAAIGQSFNVRVKRRWTEAPLLLLLLVARPGRAKSHVIRAVVRPLTEIDRRLRLESQRRREEWEEKKKAHAKDPKNTEPPGPEPPQLRAIVKDITRESLVIILKDNPRGVLCDPDEATAWVDKFDEYRSKGGADRQFWLSIWGCVAVSVDRKGGRESTYVPFPFASVLAGLPPAMLPSLAEEHGRDDGFIDRIVFVYPEDSAFPRQRWDESELSEATERQWTDAILRLHNQGMEVDDETELARPRLVSFTAEGKREWVVWFNHHSEEMESPDFPDGQAGAWSKMRSHAARFALILSRLRRACEVESSRGPDAIGADDVRGAVGLVAYVKSHLVRVGRELTGGIDSADARTILGWIRRKGLASFREADVGVDLRRFRADPRSLDDALKALVAAGAIRPRHQPYRRGRRPSPAYEVHPDLVPASENPENPENGVPTADGPPILGILGNSWRDAPGPRAEDREVLEL
jgi:hypothetical protein